MKKFLLLALLPTLLLAQPSGSVQVTPVSKGGTGAGSAAAALVNLGIQKDTDPTLAADSDARIPTQKAVKAYVQSNGGAVASVAGKTGAVTLTPADVPGVGDVAADAAFSSEGRLIVSDSSAKKVRATDTLNSLGVTTLTINSIVGTVPDANIASTIARDSEVTTVTNAAVAAAISNTAYDATSWNGDSTHAPSKDAVRDKIESISVGSGISPFTALTDAATITLTASTSPNGKVTLGANRALAIAGATDGVKGEIIVTQGSGGSKTLALPAGSKTPSNGLGVLTLSTTAGAVDRLGWSYDGTNYFFNVLGLNYTAAAPATPTFLGEIATRLTETNSNATSPLTVNTTVPIGSRVAIVASAINAGMTIASVSDTKGNTWTVNDTYTFSTTSNRSIASANLTTALASADVITVTWTTASYGDRGLAAFAFSGVTAYDSAAQTDNFGTAFSVPGSTTSANTAIIGVAGNDINTTTYGSSAWTVIGSVHTYGTNHNSYYLYKLATPSGAQDPGGTWASGVTWGGLWVAFKP